MSRCLAVTIDVVSSGAGSGVFTVEDPAFMVNCLYTQTLGMMHMARIGLGVTQRAPGIPDVFSVSPGHVKRAWVNAALAAVGVC